MAIAIDKLVTGDACEIAQKMFRRRATGQAVHLDENRLPHGLQAILCAVQDLQFPSPETTSDGPADMRPVTLDQFFRSRHIPPLKTVQKFLEMYMTVNHWLVDQGSVMTETGLTETGVTQDGGQSRLRQSAGR